MTRGAPDAHTVAPRRLDDASRGAAPLAGLVERGLPDRIVLVSLLLLAAALRFVSLASRGSWDADQGHDMLVLQAFTQGGIVPLLGPPTSIGDVHHGAAYYFLLAPLALLSGSDPTVVVGGLAVAGTAAVGVVWWLARAVGGSLAGAIAGLLIAVSPSAIEASTFLWNPNAIGLTAAVALAAAWRAQSTGWTRGWVLAGFALGLTMQLHILGVGLVVPIVGLFVWTWRRAGKSSGLGRQVVEVPRRAMALAGLGALAMIAILYIPLAINEAATGFSETRAALAFLAEGSPPDALDPVSRTLIVFLRVVAWPLVGLITDVPIPGLLVALGLAASAAWRWRARGNDERLAVRWFTLSIVWSTLFLAVAGRGLTTVIPGLPNDHYHAFVDPMVFGLIGLGLAAVARRRDGQYGGDGPGRVVVAIVVAATVSVAAGQWPPAVAADGGWPAARAAGERIALATGDRPIELAGLPLFKSTAAYGFPLADAGLTVSAVTGPGVAPGVTAGDPAASALVVACDRLFESVLLASCGGPAEERILERGGDVVYELVERFDASPRTVISIYLAKGTAEPGAAP